MNRVITNNNNKPKGCIGAMCKLGRNMGRSMGRMFTRKSAKVVPQNNEYLLEIWLHKTTKTLLELMRESPEDEFNSILLDLGKLFREGGYIYGKISSPNPLLLNRIISRVDQILGDISTVRTIRNIQRGAQKDAIIINSAMGENALAPQYEDDDPTTKYTVKGIMAMTANLNNRDDPFGFAKENAKNEANVTKEIAMARAQQGPRMWRSPKNSLVGTAPLELPRRGGSRKNKKRRTYRR